MAPTRPSTLPLQSTSLQRHDTTNPNQQTIGTNESSVDGTTRKGTGRIGTIQKTAGAQTKTKHHRQTYTPQWSMTTLRPYSLWLLSLDPARYCWSHGYCVVCGHNSTDCKGKLLGHQDTATRTNPMGGSEKGKT
jgi:hypothetical protein